MCFRDWEARTAAGWAMWKKTGNGVQGEDKKGDHNCEYGTRGARPSERVKTGWTAKMNLSRAVVTFDFLSSCVCYSQLQAFQWLQQQAHPQVTWGYGRNVRRTCSALLSYQLSTRHPLCTTEVGSSFLLHTLWNSRWISAPLFPSALVAWTME